MLSFTLLVFSILLHRSLAAISADAFYQLPLALGGTLVAPPSTTVLSKHAITPELSDYIERLLKTARIPGIALGVVHVSEGQEPVIELEAWGHRTEEGDGHDMTPDSLFTIASCSKAFLASSVGLLMDDFSQGRNVTPLPPGVSRFDWDTKLKDILPDDWVLADEWASQKANIRDILAHVSGLPRHDFSYGPKDSTQDVVRNLRNLRPAYELRKTWHYNNQMYKTGAYLVSQYANTTYTSFVKSRLFEQMNMTSSTFWPEEAAKAGKFTQTWTKFGRRIPSGFHQDIVELLAGAGGVITSAEDMTKWLITLLNHGVDAATHKIILPRSTFDEMTTAHSIIKGAGATPDMSFEGYGMGWIRWSYQGHEIVSHTGGVPGISTRVAFLPSDGLGLVLLANADEKASANEAIMYRVVEDVLGLRRVDRPLAHDSSSLADEEQSRSIEHERASGIREPPSLDLEKYTGTYSNLGYGAFTLCSPESTSHYCTEVLADFAPFRSPNEQALYASWPRIWSTHLRSVPKEGETFDFQFTTLFPRGYGLNSTAFETFETDESGGTGMFVLQERNGEQDVKGFALMLEEEAVKERKKHFEDIEGYADAWFRKI
ncbi:beta-lactamase/transpeptidase-like protein [Laetiporus sulphureus 93-53]|uniref:Beta-lactamase/transpeptidase-like protein n=1 Tax=Laetiporus sulphureus 93-53 TaxID=1314785 RepID=A0A165DJS2_9APHY|nr:beta-lactamase/transpeptidase-like protein [Laetiporus sulphureus 93-53]KZT05037.1 beta-lactamase/transpeptidase-like protein [Laetiporus sulphureus 93-53]